MESLITSNKGRTLKDTEWIVWKELPIGNPDNPYPVPVMRKIARFKVKETLIKGVPNVSDLCCASCGYQMKFDKSQDKWGCTKCGHTSQHYR
jgi:hypothetical protein